MKRSQVTVFIIIGLVMVLSFGLLYYSAEQNNRNFDLQTPSNPIGTLIFQSALEDCAKQAIIMANEEYGLKESQSPEYKLMVREETADCFSPVRSTIINAGFTETLAGPISSGSQINDETVIVNVDFPLVYNLEETSFDLQPVEYTFSRRTSVDIPGGVALEDIYLESADRHAWIIIPAGTRITDGNGNAVEELFLRVEDKNFDNYENSIVVGNLVYSGLPDGTQFSEPIEFFIEPRPQDLAGFGPDDLSLAWFSDFDEMWFSIDTVIENNIIFKGDVEHFTKFAIVRGCQNEQQNTIKIPTQYLFRQKYSADGNTCPNTRWTSSPGVTGFVSLDPANAQVQDGSSIDEVKNALVETLQEVPNSAITFGQGGNCDDPTIRYEERSSYQCCCSGAACEWKLSCEDPWISDADYNCEVLAGLGPKPADLVDEKSLSVRGYNSESCVLGKSQDDSGLFTVKFVAGGNACVKSGGLKIKLHEDTTGQCEITDHTVLTSDGLETLTQTEGGQQLISTTPRTVSINAVEMTGSDGMCAQCKAEIEITGVGLDWDGLLRDNCDSEPGDWVIDCAAQTVCAGGLTRTFSEYPSAVDRCKICEEFVKDGVDVDSMSNECGVDCEC